MHKMDWPGNDIRIAVGIDAAMKRWHFFAAFLFYILLLAGGLSLTAQHLQELQGERVTLHLLPEPVWRGAAWVVDEVRDREQRLAAFSFGERLGAVFKNLLQGMKRLIPVHRLIPWMDSCCSFFFHIRNKLPDIKASKVFKVLNTFIKGH